MKIPESIIEKYQLVPSGEHCGRSFMNNLIVFRSNHKLLQNYRVMECDLNGDQSPLVTILDRESSQKWETTIEFMADVDVELVMASML